ncbi:hypothetical protein JCM9279_002136 [Rhodotorula babjevae]
MSSAGGDERKKSFNPLPRSWRRVRTSKKEHKITLPDVPGSEHIDQANSRQVSPPLNQDGNAAHDYVAPSRAAVAAAERDKHSHRVAGLIDKHDGRFLRAHDEDNTVMEQYGDPDHDVRTVPQLDLDALLALKPLSLQPHYLSKQERAMEDSRWNLMRPRLDHYARAAFPRLNGLDGDFDERYRLTEGRLDRLEAYIGETDCEVLHAKLDHDVDELDERLRVQRPESLDSQQQLRQLNKEYELDKLLLVRYFFLHHITQRHGHRRSTADSHRLELTEEKVRIYTTPLNLQSLIVDFRAQVRLAYRDAVQEVKDAGSSPHLLVDRYSLRTARYWSVYMAHLIERRYRSLDSEAQHAELMRARRVVTHKVVSRIAANPPENAEQANKMLAEAYAAVRDMTPEALKHAYFMLTGGRNRPASVADSTHTDTATERSASPPPHEHEHDHGHQHERERDEPVSPRTVPAADYFRRHHTDDGSERRPPTPFPPPQPYSRSISSLSSASSDGGVPLFDRSSPPSPPHRHPTPLDPLSAHLAQAHSQSAPRAEPPTSRWFRGANGEGPSNWSERQKRDVLERRESAPKNVPTHAALKRRPVAGPYIAEDEVPERSSSLPQRKPGQLQINFS